MQKVTIITGGSRGIGKATALCLAQQGHHVCIGYRSREDEADEIVDILRGFGQSAMAVRVDVTDEKQIMALFQRTEKELGYISGLVNNAGVLKPQATIEQLTAERLNTIFATNVTGYFLCAREAVKRMALRHGGRGGAIVNVSSAAARLGSPHEYIDYAASKGAVDTLTIGLAQEVAAQGIRVNAVRPGFIYTGMHADGGEPDRIERIKDSLPMKRGGQPEEVAQAIAWLLSDEASYVTGNFIDLAGGK
ncbi:SDR family oxidoreductase [Xenorhabdus bovienii]|uniref:Putative NAD(P)-binding oxidoreductase with NAD(P)-binding Rossmann-fold domain n=2 Tax=Xenorhabdus TaxID=626 RepID=A0A077QGL6_XENBV|nr:SDR family oxidoreductase [Xenorhabdus bovienii]MDE9452532.1 SDR family oxidoreductase [Xenorhabdus bovienii]MDE9481267.1 SDR family oxidoreductase [Xenorhabdus bovienii]MDE9542023.1 SDR family oxidoreductase [Xenorhabdus bovienii]MDE9549976.1 SDR family oxidoreductase [Xenorhabdus bovienii]CDH32283.1 putative NAD(P)-binding oxidoreductase with NAD(P)-binding Rossmann-fold domain [Xenorhabdus bovienii str. Intermedium]